MTCCSRQRLPKRLLITRCASKRPRSHQLQSLPQQTPVPMTATATTGLGTYATQTPMLEFQLQLRLQALTNAQSCVRPLTSAASSFFAIPTGPAISLCQSQRRGTTTALLRTIDCTIVYRPLQPQPRSAPMAPMAMTWLGMFAMQIPMSGSIPLVELRVQTNVPSSVHR